MISAGRHTNRWASRARLLLLCCCLFVAAGVRAQVREYELKAVFLLNFTQLIDWPPAAFAAPNAPFVIGIVGNDPFGASIDEAVKDEKVQGHPIVVQRFALLKDVRSCQLLFVAANVRDLSGLQGQGLLTVGESADFNRGGGMIQFYTENNRVRFQVRPGLVRAAHLNISSKLLRLAKIAE